MLAQAGKRLRDFFIALHVAAEHEFGIVFGGEFAHALFQLVDNISEREFRALFVAGFGDAIGDGALGNHTCNQDFFALQHGHFVSFD